MKKTGLLLFSFIFLTFQVRAQQGLKTMRLAVYKDGTAFLLKNGTVRSPKGRYIDRSELPNAAFGTVWAYSPSGNLRSVKSVRDPEGKVQVNSFREALMENEGKRVKLILTPLSEKSEVVEHTGKIEGVSSKLVTLRTEQGWSQVAITRIAEVHWLDKPDFSKLTSNEWVLQFDFLNPHETEKLDLIYLSGGFGWTPEYLLELHGNDKASISLQGLLYNQGEDFEDADVSFVVGVPNFRYGNVRSPLMSKTTFESAMGQLYGTIRTVFDNVPAQMFTNSESYDWDFGDGGEEDAYYDEPEEVVEDAEGQEAEDFFFYTVKNISLPKGGHGLFPIFRRDIDVEHVYETTLDANYPSYSWYSRYNDEEEFRHDIWHSVRLKNSTEYPWTTGAITVVSDEEGEIRPLSQDLIKYTPEGEEADIRLAISPDISVTETEREKDRQENKKTRRRVKYDLLTFEGTIVLKNNGKEEVTLSVKRHILGIPLKSDLEWILKEKFRDESRGFNYRTDVEWKVSLKPGEERKVKYSYEVYIPHG